MIELLGALVGVAIGVLMLRHRRGLARASAGPGARGPGTTAFPDWVVRWFGNAIFGVGAVFVFGGVAQVVAVLVA